MQLRVGLLTVCAAAPNNRRQRPSSAIVVEGSRMVARILVPFHGEGEGVGELTWAQMGLWEGMVVAGRSVTMSGSAPTQPGTTVEQLAELLGFLVGRHQALRTRLRFRDLGTPLQVCVTSGEVPLEIVDTDGDPAEAAKAVEARYKEVDFDYETEFPIRMAVIRRDGAPAHMVAVYLHTVLDAGGLTALRNDMFARDPVTGAAAAPVTAIQPLEQARRQHSGSGRRQSDAAMVYLDHALRTMHPSQFGEPRYPDRGIRMIQYRSPATALAVERIAAQERLNTSSVLLAVFAIALARHTRIGQVMAMLMVGNRFRPGFADSVSPLVQLSPYLIDVGGVSLRESAGVGIVRRQFDHRIDHQAAGRSVIAILGDNGIEKARQDFAGWSGVVELPAHKVDGALQITFKSGLVERLLITVGIVETLTTDTEFADQIGKGSVLETAGAEKP